MYAAYNSCVKCQFISYLKSRALENSVYFVKNEDGVLGTAEMEGYVSLRLKFNIAVDIATNKVIFLLLPDYFTFDIKILLYKICIF